VRRWSAIAWIALATSAALDTACNAILGNEAHDLAGGAAEDGSAARDAGLAGRGAHDASLDGARDTDGLPGHGDGAFDSGPDNASDAPGETSVSDAPMSTDSQLADAPLSMDSQPADALTSMDSQPFDGSPAADGGPSGPAGLLYYFPLAGDTKDYSGHANDATNHGATLTTDHLGNPNSAYLFNGTSSYMVAPGTLLPIGNMARTVTAWVKPTNQNPTYGGFVMWGGSTVLTGGYFAVGNVKSQSFWASSDDLYTGWTVPTGVWTFVAVVFLPPNQIRFFNNAAATTLTLTYNLNTTVSSLFIGATTTNNGASWYDYYSGATDAVRIYGRSLSDAEVATVMAIN
jgi:hypothetical protein